MIEWEASDVTCPYCGSWGVFKIKTTGKSKYDRCIPNYKCMMCYTYFADTCLEKEKKEENERTKSYVGRDI